MASTLERFSFELPRDLEAHEPPEASGASRSDVRMLVTSRARQSLEDSCFRELPSFLHAGDLVVINVSQTIPAELDATTEDGRTFLVRLSTEIGHLRWVVEPRTTQAGGAKRWNGPLPTRHAQLAGGGRVHFERPYEKSERLWVATLEVPGPLLSYLAAHGRPIRYGYVDQAWPIEAYQNVYGLEPGSAEMPSAGRAFSQAIITTLVARGIGVTPITLHTGVASLESDELPYPEHMRVPGSTAERVNLARDHGHRVVAVGTTVVRALETAVDHEGRSSAYDGWTDLVIAPQRPLQVVDALLTGWHEPASSHLLMLERFLGRELLEATYRAAVQSGYHWHEFGDLHLALP